MRSVAVLLGLIALTCGHPVMTSRGDNGNELDESIARNGRQDTMLWTGSSDITAVIAPAGPLSAVAKPVGQGPTKAPVAPFKSKVVSNNTPVNKDANGLNTRGPESQGSNAPAGLSSAGNSGSNPPRGPTGNNQGGQQGQKKPGSGGDNKKNNNNNNKKNNKNKPNKDSSEEGSEESTEDGSSQESDENLESAEE